MISPAFADTDRSAEAGHVPPRGRAAAPTAPIWPAVALFCSFLIPPEAALQIGEAKLFPYRIMLFLLVPVIARAMFGKRKFVLGPIDALVVASAVLLVMSMLYHYGPAKGLESGVILAFDLLGSYFTGRCFLKSPLAVRRFLKGISPVLLAVITLMAAESLGGSLFVRPLAATLFGPEGRLGIETRIGLLRAFGPFDHPILGGLLLSSLLPLYWLSFARPAMRLRGVLIGLGAIFTVSSAPFLGLAIGAGLIVLHRVQRRVDEINWMRIAGLLGVVLVCLQIYSNNGLVDVIVRYLTLDPGTAYFRLVTWDFGSQEVARHPWAGIGFASYRRPVWMFSGSVDAHWLATALAFGLPVASLLVAATCLSVLLLSLRSAGLRHPADRDVGVAVCIVLVTFFLLMFTVTLWSGVYGWFCMLLGCSAGLSRSRGAERVLALARDAPAFGLPDERLVAP